jgi:hypothetical protein
MARPVGDENFRAILVSPDEKWLAGIDATGSLIVSNIDGGGARPLRGALPDDDPIQWSVDGRFLYIRGGNGSTIEFYRIDLASGNRQLWKRIEPADSVGLIAIQPAAVHITPDGRSYAYSYWKTLTELYLVDNLR